MHRSRANEPLSDRGGVIKGTTGLEEPTPPVQKGVPPQVEAAPDRDRCFFDRAQELFGDRLSHIQVLHPVRQMRVQLEDGTRMLLDEHGEQVGQTLPPNPPRWSSR
jgi:hypothetical protein